MVACVSLTELAAIARADLITDVQYRIELDFTASTSTYTSQTTITFGCQKPGAATVIDLAGAADLVVTANGTPLPSSCYTDNQIAVADLAAHNTVLVSATLPYAPDGDGMFRMTDPADGNEYVAGYAGMDVAHKMFACFDQPDLKAPISLVVTAPQEWTVLANGQPTGDTTEAQSSAPHRTWTFSTTAAISTYLFVVCAGPWASRTWEFAGRTFGWHARASLAAALDRDLAELQHITEKCFAHYQELFTPEYPFGDYHQIFSPGLNWGALETPGCITFRDEWLFPEPGSVARRTMRAVVIAHEMAHMWFGNLVTMRWWEDTWLQESFADYMGYRVAADAAGFTHSWVNFTLGGKARAYAADRRRSTHPVAPGPGAVPDVDAAYNNFDAISYSKGTSVLQQLVSWLGDAEFFAGLNAYLTEHAFGNATLADLVTALDQNSTQDVTEWATKWLHSTGFDQITSVQTADGSCALTVHGQRTHTIAVAVVDYQATPPTVELQQVTLTPGTPVHIAVGAAQALVPNAADDTFAQVQLAPEHWRALAPKISVVPQITVRAVFWRSMITSVESGDVTVTELIEAAVLACAHESDPVLLDNVISQVTECVAARQRPGDFLVTGGTFANALAQRHVTGAHRDELARVATNHFLTLADQPDHIHRMLSAGIGLHQVPLTTDLRWSAWQRLASLGAATDHDVDQMLATDRSTRGELAHHTVGAAMVAPDRKYDALHQLFNSPGPLNARVAGAVLAGLWQPHQDPELLWPLLTDYLAAVPPAAKTSQGLARVLGNGCPHFWAADRVVVAIADAVGQLDDIPVLHRVWQDVEDDLRYAAKTSTR